MITDEIVEAVDKLAEMMADAMKQSGARSIREMLCDFDEAQWLRMNEDERRMWLEQFLP